MSTFKIHVSPSKLHIIHFKLIHTKSKEMQQHTLGYDQFNKIYGPPIAHQCTNSSHGSRLSTKHKIRNKYLTKQEQVYPILAILKQSVHTTFPALY